MQRSGSHVRIQKDSSSADSQPSPSTARATLMRILPASLTAGMTPGTPSIWHTRLKRILFLATLGLLAVGFIHHLWIQWHSEFHYVVTPVHGLVIDAGSSGSRIHVFTYSDGVDGVPKVDLPSLSLKKKGGLSSFAASPRAAGESLKPLLQFALQHVPMAKREATPIFLMATAGLRMLSAAVVDEILEACRDVLEDSPFHFERDWATVLAGRDEGLWGWAAANYASGGLRVAAKGGAGRGAGAGDLVGVIELGGASAQVTFLPERAGDLPTGTATQFRIAGVDTELYTHSFLGYGQEAAQDSAARAAAGMAEDPCTPRGAPGAGGAARSPPGGGDFQKCYSLAKGLVAGKGGCSHARGCSVAGEERPPLTGRFLATENFFYTAEFFGLGEKASLGDFAAAGDKYCGTGWAELEAAHPKKSQQELLKYCFSAAYIVAFMHDGFGIEMQDSQVTVANTVNGVGVDWALGALLAEVASLAPPPKGALVDQQGGGGDLWFSLRFRFATAALAALGMVTAVQPKVLLWWRRRCKQLVPVFDLETGGVIYDDRTQ